jgi:hypothetical protein
LEHDHLDEIIHEGGTELGLLGPEVSLDRIDDPFSDILLGSALSPALPNGASG